MMKSLGGASQAIMAQPISPEPNIEMYAQKIQVIIDGLKCLSKESAQRILNCQKKPDMLTWPMRVCDFYASTVCWQTQETTEAVVKLLQDMLDLGANPYLRDEGDYRLLVRWMALREVNPTFKAKCEQVREASIKKMFPGVEDSLGLELYNKAIGCSIANDPDMQIFLL